MGCTILGFRIVTFPRELIWLHHSGLQKNCVSSGIHALCIILGSEPLRFLKCFFG